MSCIFYRGDTYNQTACQILTSPARSGGGDANEEEANCIEASLGTMTSGSYTLTAIPFPVVSAGLPKQQQSPIDDDRARVVLKYPIAGKDLVASQGDEDPPALTKFGKSASTGENV